MRLLIMLAAAALIVAAIGSCFFAVDQTEFVIVKRFGDPVRTLIEPGLGVKYPWPIDMLVRFDNRLMVLENPGPNEPAKEYLTQDAHAGIGKNVLVTTYTCWRIKPDAESVLTFLETMGDQQSAEARLGDVVVSELGAALGSNDFFVLITTNDEQRHWPEFTEKIRERCQQRVEREYGIEIVDVRIQRLNFPDQNRRNVFDRMRAERETIAARYRSEGDEEAARIRAKANRERDEILAEARKQAVVIRGRADAEATNIYAQAHGQDPDFYEFLRTLQAYETTFDESTTAILSSDSEFLRLLNQTADFLKQKPVTKTDEQQKPTSQPSQGE